MAALRSATRPTIKLVYATVAIAVVVTGVWVSKLKVFSGAKAEGPAVQVMQPVLNATKSQLYSEEPFEPKKEVTSSPQVLLSGIVGGANGQRLAVVSVNKSPESIVRVGDPIFADSTVTEINQDSLTYRHGSNLIRVVMQDRNVPPQGKVSTAQIPKNELDVPLKENTLPGFVASAGTAGQQSPANSKNGNVEFREAFEKKMKSLQTRP